MQLALAMIVLATVGLGLAPAHAQSVMTGVRSGAWWEESQAGLTSYATKSGNHSFSIACDTGRSESPGWAGIYLELNGKLPEPGSSVVFAIDGRTITMPVNRASGVSPQACPECIGKVRRLWNLLRTSRILKVANGDDMATFSLAGSDRVLPIKLCGLD